jgi:hypothetical protein
MASTTRRIARRACGSADQLSKVAHPIAVIGPMQPSVDGRGRKDAGDGGARGEGSLAGSGRYRRPAATEIVLFPNSFRAEEYSSAIWRTRARQLRRLTRVAASRTDVGRSDVPGRTTRRSLEILRAFQRTARRARKGAAGFDCCRPLCCGPACSRGRLPRRGTRSIEGIREPHRERCFCVPVLPLTEPAIFFVAWRAGPNGGRVGCKRAVGTVSRYDGVSTTQGPHINDAVSAYREHCHHDTYSSQIRAKSSRAYREHLTTRERYRCQSPRNIWRTIVVSRRDLVTRAFLAL